MIKLMGSVNGRETLTLGLSDGNLGRLREDKPIIIRMEPLDIPFDIVIFWKETDKALVDYVRPLISKDTIVHDDRQMISAGDVISPGPTGDYPDGKMNEDDEGGLGIQFSIDDNSGKCVIEFGKKISWLGLRKDEVLKFIDAFKQIAEKMS